MWNLNEWQIMKLIARVRSARKKWESVDQKILMQEEIISNINRSITNGDWVMETTHKEKQGLGSFISWVPPTFKETLANSLETCPKLQEGTFHNSLWCSMKENTLNNVSNKFVNLQKKSTIKWARIAFALLWVKQQKWELKSWFSLAVAVGFSPLCQQWLFTSQ